VKAIRAELIDPTIAAHNGRLVKTASGGLLVEFASVVDALRCSTEVQTRMVERNAAPPADKRSRQLTPLHAQLCSNNFIRFSRIDWLCSAKRA
jgi:class 3 adenylate cyclase